METNAFELFDKSYYETLNFILSYAEVFYLLLASENKCVLDGFNIGSFIIAISFINTVARLDILHSFMYSNIILYNRFTF